MCRGYCGDVVGAIEVCVVWCSVEGAMEVQVRRGVSKKNYTPGPRPIRSTSGHLKNPHSIKRIVVYYLPDIY